MVSSKLFRIGSRVYVVEKIVMSKEIGTTVRITINLSTAFMLLSCQFLLQKDAVMIVVRYTDCSRVDAGL